MQHHARSQKIDIQCRNVTEDSVTSRMFSTPLVSYIDISIFKIIYFEKSFKCFVTLTNVSSLHYTPTSRKVNITLATRRSIDRFFYPKSRPHRDVRRPTHRRVSHHRHGDAILAPARCAAAAVSPRHRHIPAVSQNA